MSILERRNYYGLKAISRLLKESFRDFKQTTSSVGIFTLKDGTEITTNTVQALSFLANKHIQDIPNIAYVYTESEGKLYVEVSGSILQFGIGKLLNPPTYLLHFTTPVEFIYQLLIQVGLTYQALLDKSIKRYVINSISIYETYGEPYYIRVGDSKYKVSMNFMGLITSMISNDVDTGNYYSPPAQMASDLVTFFNYYSGINPPLPIVYKSPVETLIEYRELNQDFKRIFDSTVEKLPLTEVDNIMGIQPVVIPSIQKYLFLRQPIPNNYLECFKPTNDIQTNLYYASILKSVPDTEQMIGKLTGYLPATKSRKFMITGKSGLYYERLKYHLRQFMADETRQSVLPESIFFLWTEGYNPKLDKIKCFIKNRVDGHKSITQKYNLYVNMTKLFPEETQIYMANTHILRQGGATSMRMVPGKLYIVRPSEGYSGRGISVIRNRNELSQAYDKAIDFSKGMSERHIKNIQSSPVLISDYIEDIQLYDNKKFHIRVYFMASIIGGIYRTFTWDKAELFTAMRNYTPGSTSSSVSDTHGSSTLGDISISLREFSSQEQYAHIMKITDILSTLLGQTIQLYSETENAFEIFAVDLLLRTNQIPVLMEVNSRVGYKFNTGAVYGVPFSDEFFTWINEKALIPAMNVRIQYYE